MFWKMFRFRLRRDRWQLIIWGVAHFLIGYMVFNASATTYATLADRTAVIKVMLQTPAILVFRGTPQGSSAGAMAALLGLTFIALLVILQSTFLVVRNTRAEEERGQTETLASTAAGRMTPTIAVVALGVFANVIATVALALAALAGGLPAAGAWVFGAACGAAGLAFVGITLLLVQLFPAGRTANGWAATLGVLAYFVRGIGDAAGTAHPATLTLTPSWISWLSPIGWGQRTSPWVENNGWPLLLGVGAFIVFTGIALAVQDKRDVGAGVIAERKARATASASLLSPLGLVLRLERGVLIAWIVAIIATGLLLGGLSGAMVDQLQTAAAGAGNALEEIGGGAGTPILKAFVNLGGLFSGVLASAICVQGAMRLRQEEAGLGADKVLSGTVGRARWVLSFVIVSAVGAAVALVLGGLVAGGLAGDKAGGFGNWFGATVWQFPAVLVFLGIVAFVFAVLPRATAGVGWAIFGLGAIFGMFGPLFGLPDWMRKLAPFAHSPEVTLDNPSYTGAWVMVVIAVALIVAAVLFFRQRDTVPGE